MANESKKIADLPQILPPSNLLDSHDIVLEDFNGPRGGEDKICRLVLHLTGRPAVILQERGTATVAVGMAALERAAQALSRRFDKARGQRRPAAKSR